MDTITENAKVVITKEGHEGESLVGEVVSVSRGWYTVEVLPFGTTKLRAKDLELFLDDDEDEEESESSKMTRILAEHRKGYDKTTAHDGKPTFDNGDDLAHAMRQMHPVEAMQLANMVVQPFDPEFDAFLAYGHLNNGQKRMNSGNKIRGAIKREEVTVQEVGDLIPDAKESAKEAVAAALAEEALEKAAK